MKGPGHRAKFDVRRQWLCPACGRRERTGGHVVNRTCPCRTAMRLVEEPRRRRPAGGAASASLAPEEIAEVPHVHDKPGQE